MLAALEDPAIRARAHAISVDAYHRMIEHGALAENLELIRGVLVERMPKSSLHSRLVLWLLRWLMQQVPAGFTVRPEQPLTLGDSEPEPDLAVVVGGLDDYVAQQPSTAELVIEVAISSEALDRLKLQLYAEAGVRECWLVVAEDRAIERHTESNGVTYRKVERVAWPASLESTVFPGLFLATTGLFPE
jgi:Uma2 family endonuclease